MIADNFILFALQAVRDTIGRDPIYRVRGGYNRTLTFMNLSITDVNKVYDMMERERDGTIVKRVAVVRSKYERDNDAFKFAEPGLSREGAEFVNQLNNDENGRSFVYRVVKMSVSTTIETMTE